MAAFHRSVYRGAMRWRIRAGAAGGGFDNRMIRVEGPRFGINSVF
jgi:hypothetical protein